MEIVYILNKNEKKDFFKAEIEPEDPNANKKYFLNMKITYIIDTNEETAYLDCINNNYNQEIDYKGTIENILLNLNKNKRI